jgi:hypothetical protein
VPLSTFIEVHGGELEKDERTEEAGEERGKDRRIRGEAWKKGGGRQSINHGTAVLSCVHVVALVHS